MVLIAYRSKHFPDNNKFCVNRAYVGEAMQLFKTGKIYEEVFDVLWKLYAMEFMEGYDEMKTFVHVKEMEEAGLAGMRGSAPADG